MLAFRSGHEDLPIQATGWGLNLATKAVEHLAFEARANEAATSPLSPYPTPTQDEKVAETYHVGHVMVHGIPVAIENPRGTVRAGIDPQGNPWSVTMAHHYGYVERSTGADGEGVDVFLGPALDSRKVFVVDQVDPKTLAFDEHKVMLGFQTEEEAREGYLASYEPGWQGLGDITEWTIGDFKAWLREGDTDDPVGRPVAKAGAGEGDGGRWITVHPNGEEGKGVPVRIHPVEGHEGVYHITGGAKGKLNGLRLQNVKSPEEYKAKAKERQDARQAAAKEERANLSKEEKTARKQRKDEIADNRRAAERRFIEAALRAEGVDPATAGFDAGDEEGAKLAASKHHRELLSHATKVAKEAERRLVQDAEARAAAGIQAVGGDAAATEDVFDEPSEPSAGPGYQRKLQERAKENGLTATDLAQQVQGLRTKAAENRVEDGRFTDAHVAAGEGDAVKGILAAGAALGEHNRAVHAKAKALKETKGKAVREAVKEAVLQNEALGELLQARRAMREAVKAARHDDTAPLFERGYLLPAEDLADEVVQEVEDELRTRNLESLLKEVQGDEEGGIHAALGAGAFDALHEVGLATLGTGALEREAVEVLGPDQAGIILARALRSRYTPEEQQQILHALETHHLEEQDKDLPEAMAEAERLKGEAANIQEEMAGTARDLSAVAHMQKNRLAILKEARQTLGVTLGRLESRAALIMALREAPKDTLMVPLGKVDRQAAVQAIHAMGLRAGDYTLDEDRGEILLQLHEHGQDRVLRPVDEGAMAERELSAAIKRGQMDEQDWLPAGFSRRTSLVSDDPIASAPQCRTSMALQEGMAPEALRQTILDHVASRVADGDRPADILTSLMAGDRIADQVPDGLQRDYAKAVEALFPLRRAVLGKGGQPVYQTATDGTQHLKTEMLHPNMLTEHFQRIAEEHMERRGLGADAALHTQRVDTDAPTFHEALHRTLASDPRLAAAWAPTGELGHQQQAAIRDYFYRTVKGLDPEAHAEAPKGEADLHPQALKVAGPEPERHEVDMFGEVNDSPLWTDWKGRYDQATEALKAGETLEGRDGETVQRGAAPTTTPWAAFVTSMGGLKPAQQVLQDHMRAAFLKDFAQHHGQLTGKALKQGAADLRHREKWIQNTATDEEREALAQKRQQETDSLRGRDTSGRYADGAIADRIEEHLTKRRAAGMGQQALFAEDEPEDGEKALKPGERLTLGTTLENQIAQTIQGAAKSFGDRMRPVELGRASMSGKDVSRQRAVKAITHLQRMGLFLGAGSGKTPIMLGALGELHKTGKVRKAIFAVPSAVQGQFGAEAIKFFDPQSGIQIHARPGETFQERLQAYRDPEKHGVVVTHQSLRDDTLKVLGQHKGIEGQDAMAAYVKGASREDLAKEVKAAWKAVGVDSQALFVDEGHGTLNRMGKEDSTLSRVFEALADGSDYYVPATADAIKNDPSEAFDWLCKLDPKRYPPKARDEFMRRFGGMTPLQRRSLQAELARYYHVDRVLPNTTAHHYLHTAPVTGAQKSALQAVDQAAAHLRTARTPEALLKAAQALAPGSFEGRPADQHEAIAASVKKAVGTFKEAAYNRIHNMDPEGGKVQATVALAKAKAAEGKPTVIFARNLDAVAAIHKALEAQGLKAITLTGKDSGTDKGEKIARFQPAGWDHYDEAKRTKPEADVIVMSDAGATGINLQRGQVQIQHDIPMTHMIHSQRTARIWRTGQRHDVEIHTIMADHAFDRANFERLKHKESLSSIFKSPEGFLDDSGLAETCRAIRERRGQASHNPAA